MSPTGSRGFRRNAAIGYELFRWNMELDGGIVLDADGGVRLPDGSIRAADAAWISNARWNSVPALRLERIRAICPEFIIELRSPFDSLAGLEEKMRMWMRNGVELAWPIDPSQRVVTIYRQNREPERLDTISQVAGEGPVAGFVLPLDRIFNS